MRTKVLSQKKEKSLETLHKKTAQIVLELSDYQTSLKKLKAENTVHCGECLSGDGQNPLRISFKKVSFAEPYRKLIVHGSGLSHVCENCRLAVMNYDKTKEIRHAQGNARRRLHGLARKLRKAQQMD